VQVRDGAPVTGDFDGLSPLVEKSPSLSKGPGDAEQTHP
jgi:hypothetical protein